MADNTVTMDAATLDTFPRIYPDGWTQHITACGQTYWHDTATNTTHWRRHRHVAPEPPVVDPQLLLMRDAWRLGYEDGARGGRRQRSHNQERGSQKVLALHEAWWAGHNAFFDSESATRQGAVRRT